MDIFHLYDYPKGNNTIRFHIFSESQGVMQIDVSINQTGIREIREDCRITEDEQETILYFCRIYFKLLNNKTPIKEILKIDNGATIAYRPFIIPTLSENVESVKRLIKKIL